MANGGLITIGNMPLTLGLKSKSASPIQSSSKPSTQMKITCNHCGKTMGFGSLESHMDKCGPDKDCKY